MFKDFGIPPGIPTIFTLLSGIPTTFTLPPGILTAFTLPPPPGIFYCYPRQGEKAHFVSSEWLLYRCFARQPGKILIDNGSLELNRLSRVNTHK